MAVKVVSEFNPRTRFTRKGNPYQKTNMAKIAGSVIGAGSVALSYIKNRKQISDSLYNSISSTIKNGAQIESAVRMAKIGGVAGMAIVTAGAGLALGAIVDGVVNKIKAHKADKANKVNA